MQALVWTAQIFDVNVTKSTYIAPSMSDKTAAADLMRHIASDVRE